MASEVASLAALLGEAEGKEAEGRRGGEGWKSCKALPATGIIFYLGSKYAILKSMQNVNEHTVDFYQWKHLQFPARRKKGQNAG